MSEYHENFQEKHNNALLNAIKGHLPNNLNPAAFLMDVLNIGASAAYRRLRGEIYFTLGEASLITNKLGVSLDLIIENESSTKVIPFRMCVIDYESPTALDYKILEDYLLLLRRAEYDLSSQLIVSTNMLPQQLFMRHDSLLKYFFFKRSYYHNNKEMRRYSDTEIPDEMFQLLKDSYTVYTRFKEVKFIFDKYILLYLVNDFKYFLSINLLNEEDIAILLKEAHEMLDRLEHICISGKYDNGNNVQIYISNLNFDKTCSVIKIFNHRISVVEATIFSGIAATNKICYEKLNNWMETQFRVSTNISRCGEKQRIEFFSEQREILNSFSFPRTQRVS